MLERHIERGVVKPAEQAGFFVRKAQWAGRKSAPDRVFARKDRGTVWIEFKRPGEKPTLLQAREHERMQAAGMEVHVCDNVNEALRILGIFGRNGGPPLDDLKDLL